MVGRRKRCRARLCRGCAGRDGRDIGFFDEFMSQDYFTAASLAMIPIAAALQRVNVDIFAKLD